MACTTPSKTCKELISLEIYSSNFSLKKSNYTKIDLLIEVNEDQSEEDMNQKLNNNENLIYYTKEHKRILIGILDANISKRRPEQILEMLINNSWNANKVMEKLKKELKERNNKELGDVDKGLKKSKTQQIPNNPNNNNDETLFYNNARTEK